MEREVKKKIMTRNADKKQCTAKNRFGEQCKNWARPGKNVCRCHGAGGGAPKGNKNAVSTGEHENIFSKFLDEYEKKIFSDNAEETDEMLLHELKLITIREMRLLKRIDAIKDQEFLTIKKRSEQVNKDSKVTEEEKLALVCEQAIDDALTRVRLISSR